jgi:hypothetical protein
MLPLGTLYNGHVDIKLQKTACKGTDFLSINKNN